MKNPGTVWYNYEVHLQKRRWRIERNLLISISLHRRTIRTVWGTICPWVSGDGICNAPSWLDSSDRDREKCFIKYRSFHLVIPNVNWGQERWQKITYHMFSMSFSAFFVVIWVAWNWHPSIIQYLTLTFGIKRCKLFFLSLLPVTSVNQGKSGRYVM